jgi:ribosomal protein S18 acetylase RimI-like enzyme
MAAGTPEPERATFESIRGLLRAAAAAASYDLLGGHDLDEYLEKLREKAEILVWIGEGRVQGFVAYYCNDPGRATSYVTMVVVDPRCRGRAIGETLVRSVLAATKGRSFRTCRLRVHRSNLAAIALYERCGFSRVGEEGDYLAMEARP